MKGRLILRGLLIWRLLLFTEAFQGSACTDSEQISILESVTHCRLGDSLVDLSEEIVNITNAIQVIPDVAILKRCKGSCHQQSHTCIPKTVKKKSINVMVVISQFPHGHSKTQCSTIEVEEHEKCSCGCPIKPNECSKNQYFEPSSCRCLCKDRGARNKCADLGLFWDTRRCMCICPISTWTTCSTGYTFDFLDTCKCLPTNYTASTGILLTSIIFLTFFIVSAIWGYFLYKRQMKRVILQAERRKEVSDFFLDTPN